MRLSEERPESFEVVIGYMSSRSTKIRVEEMLRKLVYQRLDPSICWNRIGVCLEFIRICDSYDICEATNAVAVKVNIFFFGINLDDPDEQLEFVFSRLHRDNRTLEAIASWMRDIVCDPFNAWANARYKAQRAVAVYFLLMHDPELTEYMMKAKFRSYIEPDEEADEDQIH